MGLMSLSNSPRNQAQQQPKPPVLSNNPAPPDQELQANNQENPALESLRQVGVIPQVAIGELSEQARLGIQKCVKELIWVNMKFADAAGVAMIDSDPGLRYHLYQAGGFLNNPNKEAYRNGCNKAFSRCMTKRRHYCCDKIITEMKGEYIVSILVWLVYVSDPLLEIVSRFDQW